MRHSRWLAPWRGVAGRPVIYHCISRVVDRRLVLGPVEKEKMRTLMRMYENFSGCRVLAYCVMSNHLHLLLEVPPAAAGGLTDAGLLERLRAVYNEAFVAGVAAELEDARAKIRAGTGGGQLAARIHARFTYRMHDLAEFMKGLLQRYTQWHNRTHSRSGTLWEDRYKSVIVEDGRASTAIAAYIDLNPVRAGMVTDPADYRWSSYGEATGGGAGGRGAKARAGLVRALRAYHGGHQTVGAAGSEEPVASLVSLWSGGIAREYRRILLAGAVEKLETRTGRSGKTETVRHRKGMSAEQAAREQQEDGQPGWARMLRHRVRYFTDGAVIGSRVFVNEAFACARERFGTRRHDGARKLKGAGAPAAGLLWSLRDLRRGVF